MFTVESPIDDFQLTIGATIENERGLQWLKRKRCGRTTCVSWGRPAEATALWSMVRVKPAIVPWSWFWSAYADAPGTMSPASSARNASLSPALKYEPRPTEPPLRRPYIQTFA